MLPASGSTQSIALQRVELKGDVHERGEESAKEDDPIVECALEPDAETEPSACACQDVQPAIGAPNSAVPQHNAAAPAVVTSSTQVSSNQELFPAQMAGIPVDAVTAQDSYPSEYDPFDRPVEEVVMQLLDDTQQANPPPAKRQQ